jgi:hypothetical protein
MHIRFPEKQEHGSWEEICCLCHIMDDGEVTPYHKHCMEVLNEIIIPETENPSELPGAFCFSNWPE